eukprot:6154524-Pyramimonas_sp.AAC.1
MSPPAAPPPDRPIRPPGKGVWEGATHTPRKFKGVGEFARLRCATLQFTCARSTILPSIWPRRVHTRDPRLWSGCQ